MRAVLRILEIRATCENGDDTHYVVVLQRDDETPREYRAKVNRFPTERGILRTTPIYDFADQDFEDLRPDSWKDADGGALAVPVLWSVSAFIDDVDQGKTVRFPVELQVDTSIDPHTDAEGYVRIVGSS